MWRSVAVFFSLIIVDFCETDVVFLSFSSGKSDQVDNSRLTDLADDVKKLQIAVGQLQTDYSRLSQQSASCCRNEGQLTEQVRSIVLSYFNKVWSFTNVFHTWYIIILPGISEWLPAIKSFFWQSCSHWLCLQGINEKGVATICTKINHRALFSCSCIWF